MLISSTIIRKIIVVISIIIEASTSSHASLLNISDTTNHPASAPHELLGKWQLAPILYEHGCFHDIKLYLSNQHCMMQKSKSTGWPGETVPASMRGGIATSMVICPSARVWETTREQQRLLRSQKSAMSCPKFRSTGKEFRSSFQSSFLRIQAFQKGIIILLSSLLSSNYCILYIFPLILHYSISH